MDSRGDSQCFRQVFTLRKLLVTRRENRRSTEVILYDPGDIKEVRVRNRVFTIFIQYSTVEMPNTMYFSL